MKRNDHIYIWIIFGVVIGFVIFLSLKEFERKEKDFSAKSKICLPGTYVSTFQSLDKKYLVCKMPDGQYWDGYHFVRRYKESL